MESSNRRIARNTLMLYIRMLLVMGITIYTSRVVLNSLGVVDYGIYNVVAGVVSLFGFINLAMVTSTQRYLTFELGKENNNDKLNEVFCCSMTIHFVLAICIVIVSEAVGLWLLYNKMSIPQERFSASLLVFHLSMASMAISMICVPFNSCIIAHERMDVFAFISVIEVTLKLIVAASISLCDIDKLKLYAILLCLAQICITLIYYTFSKRNFAEAHFKSTHNWTLIIEMAKFAGWNLWGNLSGLLSSQGVNILLNIFFGPIVNAARGIATQVQGGFYQLGLGFQSALNPQITKSYASEDNERMFNLIFASSKITFFLLSLASMPILCETSTILTLWLKKVPEHTVIFAQIAIVINLVDCISNPLLTAAAATGKIRGYQTVVGGILIATFPASFIILKLGAPPFGVYLVNLGCYIGAFLARLYFVKRLINLPLKRYFKNVIARCIIVAIVATATTCFIKQITDNGTTTMSFVTMALVLCSTFAIITTIGLTKTERGFITETIRNKFLKS